MTVAGARAWLQARAESYGRDAGILRHSGDTDDALLYEAIRDELRACAEGAEEAVEVRCCKGCPDCMGIGSREQIKGMLADIRKVIGLCEAFEATGRLSATTGYVHSTRVRDILGMYQLRSAGVVDNAPTARTVET